MLNYVVRRLLIALLAIFVLTTLTFFLLRLVPGDPFAGPRMPPEIQARLREHYGLDKPLIQQYFVYLGNIVRGDFGYSLIQRGRTVRSIIADTFPYSLDLGLRAMVFAVVAGLFFGTVAALKRGKPLDYFTVILVLVGISIPSFVVGGILQWVFAVWWPVFPVARYESFSHTVLPAFALALGTLANIARYMRASMLEVVGADYVKTARAKGLSPARVVWRHEIRNALFPVLTILGPIMAMVLTGSFVIETIFAVPGLGRSFVLSMQNLDYTMVMGLTIFFGAFLILMNFLVDVLYGIVDPRVRVR